MQKDIKYKYYIGLNETHVVEKDLEEIKIGKKTYNIYHNGIEGENKFSGVGISIEKHIEATFARISDRICIAKVNLEDSVKMFIIVVYAHTLTVSEKKKNYREDFYKTLSEISRKVAKSRHMLVTLGDFNAKTGSGYHDFPDTMGRFGKGHLNSSGKYLLEYAKENGLYLTNTTFPHKMAHRTTWTAPQRNKDHNHNDGSLRNNPYRNQNDYILTKTRHKMLIQDSRSYSGFETSSDHKMVITKFVLKWWKLKRNMNKELRVDVNGFNDKSKVEKYQSDIILQTDKINEITSTNEKWKCMTEICIKSAKENIGTKKFKGNNIYSDDELKNLSKLQKKLKLKGESTLHKVKRKAIKKERNNIRSKIKDRIKVLEEEHLEKELQEIENNGQNQKAYEATKTLKRMKPKKKLKVYDDKGNMSNTENQQVKLLTEHFRNIFEKPDQQELKYYPPCENKPPFSEREIKNAVRRLKNGKSPGIDGMAAEML